MFAPSDANNQYKIASKFVPDKSFMSSYLITVVPKGFYKPHEALSSILKEPILRRLNEIILKETAQETLAKRNS